MSALSGPASWWLSWGTVCHEHTWAFVVKAFRPSSNFDYVILALETYKNNSAYCGNLSVAFILEQWRVWSRTCSVWLKSEPAREFFNFDLKLPMDANFVPFYAPTGKYFIYIPPIFQFRVAGMWPPWLLASQGIEQGNCVGLLKYDVCHC